MRKHGESSDRQKAYKSHVCEKKYFSFLNIFFVIFFFSSKRDNELLLRLIANLNMLLKDDSVNVVKKAILTLTQLYKVTLQVNTLFSAFIYLWQ